MHFYTSVFWEGEGDRKRERERKEKRREKEERERIGNNVNNSGRAQVICM